MQSHLRSISTTTPDATGNGAPDWPSTLRIVPWPDPVIDALGYDPRSWYVEQFWLGVVGPTSAWLLRRLAAGLDTDPGGFDIDVAETARALGLRRVEGMHSPFGRAVTRCVAFGLARHAPRHVVQVRRWIPPLPRRHLIRLPRSIQDLHESLSTEPNGAGFVLDHLRSKARRLALGLLEIGEDRDAVEVQLLRWRIHPALAHESAEWARAFRVQALADIPDGTGTDTVRSAPDEDRSEAFPRNTAVLRH